MLARTPIEKTSWRSWLMLALLCLAFLLSLVDRLLLSLMVEPIKADLDLTDTQIGLIQGLAFVVLYSGLAIPVGRYVDRNSRIPLVSGGVALWSLMTAACGLSSTPLALALGRAGVGVGESTLAPAAPSLIADSFPKARLGLAMSIFALGASLGAGLSLMLGGAITHALEVSGPISLPVVGTLQAADAGGPPPTEIVCEQGDAKGGIASSKGHANQTTSPTLPQSRPALRWYKLQ